ncbi:MAG: type II toxin-antitoxin system RelE/ParE family toxin [Candidatus Saccharimonadia bacterium]
MAKYQLKYKKPALKQIQKLSPQIRKRLKSKLEWFIAQADPLEFCEPLTKPTDAEYRFRVGDYRILFDVEKDNLVILYVQHRRDVYKK